MRSVIQDIWMPWYLLLFPLLFSCASYNQKIQRFYTQMEAGKYSSALQTIDHISYLQKPRNRFLYYAEKGRVAHLAGMYDSSNHLMNEADRIAEVRYRDAGDIVVGNLLNPMMETYYGESFERFMLHYYKALNYYYLNDIENALVEARRISIATNDQMDRTKEKDNRYSRDAFSLNMQGIIYELAGDLNNAFIAYRNAAETYLSHADNTWYGVRIPEQLKTDVLRTAYRLGFTGELQHFENLFKMKYEASAPSPGGELVLFIEKGNAPVKAEENLFFSLLKGQGGFYFTDPAGGYSVPFDVNRYNTKNADLSDLRTFRVALPKYIISSAPASNFSVIVNGQQVGAELVQDLNTVAEKTMQERRLKDITAALTRLFIKKMAEAGARAAGKSLASSNGKKDTETEEEKKKRERKAEATGAAVGLIFQAFALASEKADTRNWQSLPAHIHYMRIPLKKGKNTISVPGAHGPKEISVEGNGGLQLLSQRCY